MKMKRNLIVTVFVLALFMAAAVAVSADSAEDYKVIKKAVKGKKGSGELTWFRLEVTDKKTDKSKVKIKVPISLVDLLAECEDDININTKKGKKCKLNLKKIIEELKKSGSTSLIEVDSDDSFVKIWFE